MKKALLLALVTAATLLIFLQGCQAEDLSQEDENAAAKATAFNIAAAGPDVALEEIYKDIDILGINPLTKEIFTDKFLLETSDMAEVWGKYADGRYGLSDVYIIRPTEGKQDAVRGVLEEVKVQRTVEFRSYDIYNALKIAEDGVVFETNGYVILVMLEDNETAISIIEDALNQK